MIPAELGNANRSIEYIAFVNVVVMVLQALIVSIPRVSLGAGAILHRGDGGGIATQAGKFKLNTDAGETVTHEVRYKVPAS